MMDNETTVNEPQEKWGGYWTEMKLEAFSKYVWSYLQIMKKMAYWKTIYFDGFAGCGSRQNKKSQLFVQLNLTGEDEDLYKSSAERVLSIKGDLSFDYYYFIDTNEKAIDTLQSKLEAMEEAKSKQLLFRSGDANKWLRELAKTLKTKKYTALIFLDPFGMQIDWESIEILKGTRSDIWILIPSGVIVNRLLDRKGELKNIKKLESFFGLSEDEIRIEFYETEKQNTFFGEIEITKKVLKPIEKIASLYLKRLNSIWTYTIDEPLRLENSRKFPIYHFAFASNNKNAVRIANQIIKKI